jgi:hypothetical protein
MAEVVEIRRGRTIGELVEQLAASVGEASISLPVQRRVGEGDWVRFHVALEDGSPVIEGIGRSLGSIPRGSPIDHYELHLGELQLDERNQIMHERILLAKAASEDGDNTGATKLSDAALTEIERDALADEKTDERPAPPPTPGPRADVRRDSKPEIARAVSSPILPRAVPRRVNGAYTPPPVNGRRPAAKPTDETLSPPPEAPDIDPPPPSRSAGITDGAYMLEIEPEHVTMALRLEQTLPRALLARDRKPGKPEATVLAAALRIGLAALDAIADED